MNKKNAPTRRGITDSQFSQPVEFIRATGYTPKINHMDTQVVSLHVISEANRNLQMENSNVRCQQSKVSE